MDFAYENGCEALALTDHGNMNGFAYQVLHAKKMKAAGKKFKPIFGVEHFIPSIPDGKNNSKSLRKIRRRPSRLMMVALARTSRLMVSPKVCPNQISIGLVTWFLSP